MSFFLSLFSLGLELLDYGFKFHVLFVSLFGLDLELKIPIFELLVSTFNTMDCLFKLAATVIQLLLPFLESLILFLELFQLRPRPGLIVSYLTSLIVQIVQQ